MSFFFLRETYPCAILNQKTKRLRRTTGNGGLRSTLEIGRDTRRLFSVAIIRPSKMLIFSPIVSLLSLYLFILNGYLYLFFTALPGVLEREYGFSSGQVGLSYLGNGTGSILGLLVSGVALDWLAESLLERNGGVYRPEYRLPLMILAGIAVPVGLLWFGWTANFKQHWILPIVGTSFLGFGIMLAYVRCASCWPPWRAQALIGATDGHLNLSRRRLRSLCRLRRGCQHRPPVARGCDFAAGWRQDV